MTFEADAQFAKFPEFGCRHLRNHDPSIVPHLQSVFGRQTAQGLAHRHGADTQGRRHIANGQGAAGRDQAYHHRTP
jgi:hypothetical protein